MPRNTLRIVATLQAADGKRDELEAVLQSMLQPSRGDDGCLSYELYEDTRHAGTFVFIEEWRDKDAAKAHGAQAHMAEAGQKLKGLLAGRADIRYLSHLG